MKEAIKYGLILTIICFAASGLLVCINLLTAPRIEVQIAEERNAAFKEVLIEAKRFEPVEKNGEAVYYRGLDKNGKVLGVVFTAQGKGYSSAIETVVGMLIDGTITGIKIVNHNETPGLGSRIAEFKDDTTLWDVIGGKKQKRALKPWFQEQFSGKKTDQLGEVQAITGATISSEAVIKSVQEKAREIERLIKQ